MLQAILHKLKYFLLSLQNLKAEATAKGTIILVKA